MSKDSLYLIKEELTSIIVLGQFPRKRVYDENASDSLREGSQETPVE